MIMVKVLPANEQMMKILKHGVTHVGFTSMDQPVDWPEDTFTHRRVRDGDVKLADSEKKSKN